MITHRRFTLVSPGLAVLAATALLAQQAHAQDVPPKVRAACTSDYLKLCSTVIPGNGRVIACMTSKLAELSSDCKATLLEAKAQADKK